ncbi:hypothetical protein QBC40DRAFT_37514 [Triangularia verruculosa]|uniref:F-box domain-containing protein n=1 Tax=Triangularia verruculosa TaxID=2587418 RepID=A0AAN6XLD3_9PEZI|nr:hypothetical protein QBC40DRAFT_37514 [Triangularia verruculosa]
MDLLPVELVRFVYQYCDPPTVRTLRLASAKFAEIGCDFLLPDHFTAVEWKDDIRRLHAIARHERLCGRPRSLVFHLAKVHVGKARQATFLRQWLRDREGNDPIEDAWSSYHKLEERASLVAPLYTRQPMLEAAFKRLPNLESVDISFTKNPYGLEFFNEIFQHHNCRKQDRPRVSKDLDAIVSALPHVRLQSLSIDQVPLELFRQGETRQHWFDCAPTFANLSRLDLVLDVPPQMGPAARSRAINGLGKVLQSASNLTHLRLAFHTYHAPAEKFELSFRALFAGDFTYKKLTDLKLEGISCSEQDLKAFLLRHSPTLERLRLGGRGLAKPCELSIGGIHLHNGRWRSLFAGLKENLVVLQRFHLEGDIESGDAFTRTREVWDFLPMVSDDWSTIYQEDDFEGWYKKPGTSRCKENFDSIGLERFLISGGPWPMFIKYGNTSAYPSPYSSPSLSGSSSPIDSPSPASSGTFSTFGSPAPSV